MLNKNITGRLGNQMFQYAAVRSFQEKYCKDDIINLDFQDVYNHLDDDFTFEILKFKIKKCRKTKMKKNFIQRIIIDYLFVVKVFFIIYSKFDKRENFIQMIYKYELKHQPFFNKFGLYIMRCGYSDFKNSNVKNKVFLGTFESSKYFDNIRNILLDEFTPKYDVLEKNKILLEDINNSESVCITIRRGDFVSNKKFKNKYYICTPSYFERGIEEIKKRVKKPKFFIFSDDIEWCKNNLKLPKNCVFESGDDPVYEKLRLMYSCKHFVISNSTFSWWAQYLSRNKDKVVIAPSRWQNNSYHHDFNGGNMDIYEKGWILINIDD
jgi:hypothetical protein